MTYTVEYRSSVKKELRSLPKIVRIAVVAKIQKLAQNPKPIGSSKLKGSTNLYRIRHSSYRVIYQVKDDVLLVIVVRVGHRRDVYKNL